MAEEGSMKRNKQNNPPVIAIVGQTATGKTGLGVALAQALNSEVISADSQLVYTELNIGTAKPTPEEIHDIPHHMIDLVNPDEEFSVSRYQSFAKPILNQLHQENKIPIVVGGTGFYFRALLQEKFFPDVPPNPEFRKQLKLQAQNHPAGYLHLQLAEKDPNRAKDLHPNDHVRIIRALEIIQATGKPVPLVKESSAHNVIWIGLTYEDRDYHRKLIDDRIDAMLDAGWVEETEALMKKYSPDAHALQVAHGYPEWVAHLQNKMTFHDAREQVRINIHQYSRRQMTFFRKNQAIQWFDAKEYSTQSIAEKVLHLVSCSKS